MKKVIIAIVVAIIALIIAMPHIKEYRAYSKVKDENTVSACENYIFQYPDGKHLEDVRYLKVVCSDSSFDAVTEYLYYYPSGVYADEVRSIYDNLWNEEIEKYMNRDKSKESEEAVQYMMEMLQYMKKNYINSIAVNVEHTLKLKDYEDYPIDNRKILELVYSDESLPLEGNVISLKSNFNQGDLDNLKEILINGVQKSMDNMFTPGFINVASYAEDRSDCPQLTFNYTIQSQEEEEHEGFPHLWVYTEEKYGREIPISYLIGISIRFDADFSIPNSSVTYTYSEKGEPEDNINNIDDIRDGYRRMTAMCFAQFSNKMSKNMGLKETYFQGE